MAPHIPAYTWRLCPYATQNTLDTRIPVGQKTNHTVTLGRMRHTSGGFFTCEDPACSFYTGVATTGITYKRWHAHTQTVVSGTITPAATGGKWFSEG